MAAPVESVTVPVNVPVTTCPPVSRAEKSTRNTINRNSFILVARIEFASQEFCFPAFEVPFVMRTFYEWGARVPLASDRMRPTTYVSGRALWAFAAVQLAATTLREQIVITFLFGGLSGW